MCNSFVRNCPAVPVQPHIKHWCSPMISRSDHDLHGNQAIIFWTQLVSKKRFIAVKCTYCLGLERIHSIEFEYTYLFLYLYCTHIDANKFDCHRNTNIRSPCVEACIIPIDRLLSHIGCQQRIYYEVKSMLSLTVKSLVIILMFCLVLTVGPLI